MTSTPATSDRGAPDLGRDQRVPGPALYRRERRQQHHGQGKQQQCAGGCPAVGRRTREGVDRPSPDRPPPAPRQAGRAHGQTGLPIRTVAPCAGPAGRRARPTGTFTRKTDRQPSQLVSIPPASTTRGGAGARPSRPRPRARRRAVHPRSWSVMIDRAAGVSSAAPSPWPALAAISAAAGRGQAAGQRCRSEHGQAGSEDPAPADEVRGPVHRVAPARRSPARTR